MRSAKDTTALIIEPIEARRDKFKYAIGVSEKFHRAVATSSIEEAKKILKAGENFSHVFLSSELADAHMTEFVTTSKANPNAPKFILAVMSDKETRRKIIEKATVIGVDAILFGSHTSETISEALASIDQTDKPLGPLSPISLLIKEIIGDIDSLSQTKSRVDEGFKTFRERLSILRKFSQEELDSYLAIALEMFIHNTQPPQRSKLQYSGASRRVRQIIDQYNNRG